MLSVVMDAPIFNDDLCFSKAVEDFTIQTFTPKLLCRPGVPAGHGNSLVVSLQQLNPKFFLQHLLSHPQFNNLKSSGSEKAAQVTH